MSLRFQSNHTSFIRLISKYRMATIHIKQNNNFHHQLMKLNFYLLLLLPTLYSLPTLSYDHSFNTFASPAHVDDSCKQLKITSNYVVRLGTNNVIEITNKSGLKTQGLLLNYTYSVNSTNTPNIINSFDLNSNQTHLLVSQSDSTKALNLMNFALVTEIIGSFYKIIYAEQIMVMKNGITGNDQLSKSLNLPSSAPSTTPTLPIINFTLPNVKNCKCSQSPNTSYLVYWDQYSNVYLFANPNTTNSPIYKGKLLSQITVPNLTQSITFSADGEYFVLQADDQLPLSIVSLSPTSLLAKRSLPFMGVINKAMFLEASNKYLILFNETAYTVVSTVSLSVIYSQSLLISTNIIEIDYAEEAVYFCRDEAVQIYRLKQLTCSMLNCAACLNATKCLECNAGFIVTKGICELQNSTNNGTNNNYSLLDPASLNSSNSNSSISKQDENITLFYLMMPDGSMMIYQVGKVQSDIINGTCQALKYTNKGLQKLMLFLTSTPFMFLLIGNIQFFSISSLYIFLNAPIPLDLYNVLKNTMEALNSNVFTTFHISIDVPVLSTQKADIQSFQLGVSSQFLGSNYEYLILSLGVTILVSGCGWVLGVLGCWKGLRELILQNKHNVFLGLILSGLPQFALPFVYEYTKPQTYSVGDRINLSTQFILVGFIILFCPAFISSIGYANKVKVGVGQKRKGSFIRLWRQRDTIYIILLNVLFPLLVFLSRPLYFLAINFILLIFGLVKAYSYKRYRLNKILLATYPIIFHICFMVFTLANKSHVIVVAQIVSLLVYFIGAAHQFITIISQFAVFLYHLINRQTNNNQVAPAQNDQPQQSDTVVLCPFQPNKTQNHQSHQTYKFKHKSKAVNEHRQVKVEMVNAFGEKRSEMRIVHWERRRLRGLRGLNGRQRRLKDKQRGSKSVWMRGQDEYSNKTYLPKPQPQPQPNPNPNPNNPNPNPTPTPTPTPQYLQQKYISVDHIGQFMTIYSKLRILCMQLM